MKIKKYIIIILLLMLYFIPNSAFAAGNISVSTTKINVLQGKTTTFKISANNAAGKIDITSSNNKIASVSSSSVFLDMNSETITVKGQTVGKTTIKVFVADVTTYDDEDLTGKVYNIDVIVSKSTQTSTQQTKPSTDNSVNNLSTNNNLKSLSVEGYLLKKIDSNNYEVEVNKDVESLNVIAETEDSKAKVSGIGIQKLEKDKNVIEVVVTSESGIENKINIKIIRKDELSKNSSNIIENIQLGKTIINIDYNTKITKEELNEIKKSGKIVYFNYYDENQKLIYSWIADGKNIKNPTDILTTISFESNNQKRISELSNSADGINIIFKHKGNIPNGIKVKLYVGNKYTKEELINVYYYNEEKNTLTLIHKNIKVKDGYVEYKIDKSMECFITTSRIKSKQAEMSITETTIKMSFLFIITALIICIFIKSLKKQKN